MGKEALMLSALSLRDFVIVDALEITFESGLTVLTGETGAGKSILVDALSLALGERADAGVVREGAQRTEISAEFDIDTLDALQAWLAERDYDDEQRCVLRRIIDSGGRSRCYINGRSATVQQLREAGEFLLDLHGQHAHQSLLKPAAQRELLDGYAGAGELAHNVARAFRQYHQLHERVTTLQQRQDSSEAERERLAWQVQELLALHFDPQDWQSMQSQHTRLANSAQLGLGLASALAGLADDEPSVLSLLHNVHNTINQLVAFDTELQPMADLLESARAEISEAHHSLRHYAERLDADPAMLAEIEQRIAQVMALARKYRVRPEQLPECQLQAQQQLAQQLSQIRTQAAGQLSAEVSRTMQQLALAGGHFAISLTPSAEGGAHGLEQVEFLVAAHEGMTARPLQRVASGGELSRISLALQTAISRVAAVPVLIFDEVDVGIGGGVAEIVGTLLRQLASHRQIICITHLPQVAAQGAHHLQVSKIRTDQGVTSRIQLLTPDERIDELARMLGGMTITPTTREHAREMLTK